MDLSLLPRTLQDVVEGGAAIPRTLVARWVKQFHASDPRFRTTDVSSELGTRLTSREWDVLAALADGWSTREIGRRLRLKQSEFAPTSPPSCASSASRTAKRPSPSSATRPALRPLRPEASLGAFG